MNRYFLPFIFIFSLLLSNPARALDQKGMSLGLFSKQDDYSYLKDLQAIKALGVTHIQLVVSWYQKDVTATEIGPRKYDGNDIYTIPDAKLIEVITQAHELGLKVLLFPILRLEVRQGKDWRGVIAPTNTEAWWTSYNRFILHYAQIAQNHKADLFSVGSELLSREAEEKHWNDLIDQTRAIYSGKLIYSSNWDHYRHVPFWEKLDWIGMTAYHELSKTKKPTLAQLKAKWRRVRREILVWKKKEYPNQKLILTEIGYPSVDGTNTAPWNYFMEGPVDVWEQALCYRAFIETWKQVSSLDGVYFWVWWGEGGKKDNSYTPRGKPAERYLRQWYKKKN